MKEEEKKERRILYNIYKCYTKDDEEHYVLCYAPVSDTSLASKQLDGRTCNALCKFKPIGHLRKKDIVIEIVRKVACTKLGIKELMMRMLRQNTPGLLNKITTKEVRYDGRQKEKRVRFKPYFINN